MWKTIEDNSKYEISDFGLIRNRETKRILKPQSSEKGYLYVHLRKEGIRRVHLISRAVAQAFIPNPENKPEVNHKDGVKSNNSVANLEWSTRSENKLHAFDNGLQKSGSLHGRSKLKEKDVKDILELLKVPRANLTAIARMFSVSANTIANIRDRKKWRRFISQLVGSH